MNIKIFEALSIILPNKKSNYFIMTILILGIISGSIFITIINNNDKSIVIEQIKLFTNNINSNSLNNGLALKSSLIINYLFIIIMWILGLSFIGILINTFLVYIKGFIVGFSVASLIVTYKIKGIIASFFYIFPHTILNLFAVLLLGTYTIIITKYMLNQIINKKINAYNPLKKYVIILGFVCIITLVSSLLEVFLFPSLLKLIIKLYV